jgi:hypothetical protein
MQKDKIPKEVSGMNDQMEDQEYTSAKHGGTF